MIQFLNISVRVAAMTFLMATLQVVGSDASILTLDESLGIPFWGAPKTFEEDGVPTYFAMLTIIEEELPEEIGVERTFDWLSRNIESLMIISGRLKLEIQGGLALNDGSRFLTIPVEGLELLISLDCDLRFQFIKEFPGRSSAGN